MWKAIAVAYVVGAFLTFGVDYNWRLTRDCGDSKEASTFLEMRDWQRCKAGPNGVDSGFAAVYWPVYWGGYLGIRATSFMYG